MALARVVVLLALAAAAASGAHAQAATHRNGDSPPRRLPSPLRELDESFSSVGGVIELAGGRLLVSDAREKRVVVLDAAGNVVRSIGREGRGPGEFVTPGGLYPIRGDTTLLYDRAQDRFLVIDPALDAGATREPRAARRGTTISDSDPYDLDTLGRIVRQERQLPGSSDRGASSPTHERLVRFDPATGRTDSVATLRIPTRTVTRDGPITVSRVQPFGPLDAWAVAPDGRVAIVRAEPYRVEWWENGRMSVSGPAVSYRPVPVTDADRDSVVQARERSPVRIGVSAPGGARQPAAVPAGRDPDFPEVKAPFRSGAARTDLLGRVWVERVQPAGTQETVFDVFDRSGRLVDRIAIPSRHRLVGFGDGVIYLVRRDADDLEWIQIVGSGE